MGVVSREGFLRLCERCFTRRVFEIVWTLFHEKGFEIVWALFHEKGFEIVWALFHEKGFGDCVNVASREGLRPPAEAVRRSAILRAQQSTSVRTRVRV